jgi:hypothetical protein
MTAVFVVMRQKMVLSRAESDHFMLCAHTTCLHDTTTLTEYPYAHQTRRG